MHRERRERDGALSSTLLADYQVASSVQDKKLSPVLLPAWVQMLVLWLWTVNSFRVHFSHLESGAQCRTYFIRAVVTIT